MVELCERHKLSVIVLLLFSAINILALVGNVLVVSEPEDLVERIVNYLDTQSEQLRDEVLLNTVREILQRYINDEDQWDNSLAESAKGSLIYSWTEKEETVEDLVEQTVKAYMRQTDSFYNRLGYNTE